MPRSRWEAFASRLHAAARRWPPAYRNSHHLALISLPLLLVSGVALYLPAWHAPLIPYLPWIYTGHIALGIAFALLLLLPILSPLPTRHLNAFDWSSVITLGGGLTLTGLMLWRVNQFPVAWRANSFTWHGLLSILIGAWAIWHGWLRIQRLLAASARKNPGQPVPVPQTPDRRILDRRQFLTWASSGLAAAFAAALFGSPLIRLWQELGRPVVPQGAGPSAASRGWPGFQLYTVTGDYPDIPSDQWTLTVSGLVDRPTTFRFSDFMSLPQVAETKRFQCVTGWVVPDVRWAGVRLSEVLDRVQPQAAAKYVILISGDGAYTESLTLEQARDDQVLLAHSLNGSALPRAQGAPVRLVVPNMYGYKSIKWVTGIRLAAEQHLGYWEVRGYTADAYITSSGNHY